MFEVNRDELRVAQVRAHKTVADLCNGLGITEKTYYKKLGNGTLTLKQANVICEVLGITALDDKMRIFMPPKSTDMGH